MKHSAAAVRSQAAVVMLLSAEALVWNCQAAVIDSCQAAEVINQHLPAILSAGSDPRLSFKFLTALQLQSCSASFPLEFVEAE